MKRDAAEFETRFVDAAELRPCPPASTTPMSITALAHRRVVPGLPARFLQHPNSANHHSAIDGFEHIVKGEAGDARGGQRFHLDACLTGRCDICDHAKPVRLNDNLSISTLLSARKWHKGISMVFFSPP